MSQEQFAEMPQADYTKSCNTCCKVSVCKYFMQFSQFKEQFESQSDGKVIIPLDTSGLAMTCKEFSQ